MSKNPNIWSPRNRLFGALLALFALKLLVVLQLKNHPLLQPDSGLDTTAYVHLAEQVLAGNLGLGPGLYYVSPFYIYFLAAALAVAHNFTVVRVVQIGLGTLAAGGIWLMTREWFGERAAWYALALSGLTGLVTFYEILLLQSSVDIVLTSAALCALTFALTRNRPSLFVASGVIFGLMTLNRPNVLLAAAALVVVLAGLRRVRFSVLLLLGIIAGIAPAAIRNVVVSHQLTFASSQGGLNFYIGNRPGATGFYDAVPGVSPTIEGQQTDTIRVASKALGHPVSASEASDYFFGLAWSWMRQHPLDAITTFARKCYYVFNTAFTALPYSYPFYAYDAHSLLRFLFVGPWLLIPLGLVGLMFGRRPTETAETVKPAASQPPKRSGARDRKPKNVPDPARTNLPHRIGYVVWVTFVPAYAAAVAIFFMADRYRLPLLVPLTVGAGAAIALAVDAVSTRRLKSVFDAAVVFVLLAIATNSPLGLDNGRWQEGLKLAQRFVVLGRYKEAAAEAARISRTEPQPGATDYGVATQMLKENQPTRALPYLEKADRLNPAPLTDYTYGEALLAVGRAKDAVPHLAHGFDAGVPLPQGGFAYAVALREVGDTAGALSVLRRTNPGDDPDACLRLGRFAVEAKAPDVAEPFFRRAVQLQPDAASHQQLGVDLLLLGKFDEAAGQLADAARLDPRDAGTLSHLAYCDMKLGQVDDARTYLAQALAIDPNDPLARQLATVLR